MRLRTFSLIVLLLATLSLAGSAYADGILGSDLSSFAVLGSSTVTNTGPTTITGDVGVYPGTAITDQAQITFLGGSIQDTTPLAESAQGQLTTAMNTLIAMPVTQTLTVADLGGQTLTPGVYAFTSTTVGLTGTLTLTNPSNVANPTWVFLIGKTLTTASDSVVDVNNTAAGAGVYWDIGSSATLGTGTAFEGNILAADSITLTTSATDNCGRVLASTGAVTMDTNTISTGCTSTNLEGGAEGSGTNGFNGGVSSGGGGGTTMPEPGTLVLLLSGLFPIALLKLRKLR